LPAAGRRLGPSRSRF